jgi:hypothetical protein
MRAGVSRRTLLVLLVAGLAATTTARIAAPTRAIFGVALYFALTPTPAS